MGSKKLNNPKAITPADVKSAVESLLSSAPDVKEAFIPGVGVVENPKYNPPPAPVKLKAIGADELLSSHDQDLTSIHRDLKELQGDLGRIVKLLAQVLGGEFAAEAQTILTKRQEVN